MNRSSRAKSLEEPHPRKAATNKQLALHSLSPLQSKFLSGIPDVVAHEEKELARLSKLMQTNMISDPRQDNILRKILPKYRPNSKAKYPPSLLACRELNKAKSNVQPLKTSQSDADHHHHHHQSSSAATTAASPSTRKSVRAGSCMKISASLPQNNTNSKKANNSIKVKQPTEKPSKVRFSKKITIHYVPSDEERGCYEWRKNLTRQGIYEAMMWKTELARIEMEEQQEANLDELIRKTSNTPEALAAYGLLN